MIMVIVIIIRVEIGKDMFRGRILADNRNKVSRICNCYYYLKDRVPLDTCGFNLNYLKMSQESVQEVEVINEATKVFLTELLDGFRWWYNVTNLQMLLARNETLSVISL